MLTWDYQTTKQGFELATGVKCAAFQSITDGHLRTNLISHVGHFLFTVKLLPILKATANEKGADVRVVTVQRSLPLHQTATNHHPSQVSSTGHAIMMPDLTFTLPSDFTYPGVAPSPPSSTGILNQISRNAVGKSANILFASELQRHMDAENIPIISTSLSPGIIATEGQAGLTFGLLGPVWWLIKTFASGSPGKGAVPSLYLAVAKEVRNRRGDFAGRYFEPSLRAVAPSKLASDPKIARNLWKLSEETVGKWTAT